MNDEETAALLRFQEVAEIERLKARYCRYVDMEDWDGFRSLFTSDACFQTEGQCFSDAEQFVAGVVKHHTAAEVVSVHHVHMPEIEISGQTATGFWRLFDYIDRIWRHDGRREAFHGYGFYDEQYLKVGAEWKISAMTMRRIRVDRIADTALGPFPHRGAPPTMVLPPSAAPAPAGQESAT